ncbi:hypothetical protein ACI6QG_08415 [Roseococcus sp. DSY-14]|uniref:alginate O-acetyltransferase AlgX-related protein n=1 Tax=Roseococcus sp. DSY-14 TaxID=3369650 RepID=UPI00387B6B72
MLLAALPAPALAQGGTNGPLEGPGGWLFAPWERPDRMELRGMPRVAALFRQVAALLAAAGIRPGFLLVPAKARVHRDSLPPGLSFTPEGARRHAAMLEELRPAFPLLPDLDAAFAAARQAQPGEELFFRADSHWRPEAAALAAAEVARLLPAAAPLPPARALGLALGPEETRLRTQLDLAQLLPPARRAAFPPEPYRIRPPQRARPSALLDAAPAEVAVVGSSLVAPELNFHAELSARLGRPVSLHWRVQTRGPFDILLTYLRGEGFRQERPRLLLLCQPESGLMFGPESRAVYPETAMAPEAFLAGVRQALAP